MVATRQFAVVSVVGLVVLAGCGGLLPAGDSNTGSEPTERATDLAATPTATAGDSGTSPVGTSTARSTDSSAGTSSATPTPRAHPWADRVVAVAVANELPGNRSVSAAVRDAIAAWNGTRVTGGTVRFRLVEPETDADFVLTVTPRVDACDGRAATTRSGFEYCMPRLSVDDPSGETRTGRVSGAYDAATLTSVVQGAFALPMDRDAEDAPDYPPERYTYDDPWPASSPVVVNVSTPGNRSRDITPLVREAITWWDDRPASDRDYATDFVVRPNASNADVEVVLVEKTEQCGVEDRAEIAGCAPLFGPQTLAEGPATVRVEAGYVDASTLAVLKHEFGHVYGREHGDTPTDVMRPKTSLTRWPVTNATDREFPWNETDLSVYVDAQGDTRPGAVWADVEPAFDYFERGADGWLERNVTFSRTTNRSEADIVVRTTDESACGFENGGLCDTRQFGRDLDSDPALEYYAFSNFTLTVTDDRKRAWFAGYAVAFALGSADAGEHPDPLQDVDNADERWWE